MIFLSQGIMPNISIVEYILYVIVVKINRC